jgi:hypothetical protein
MGKKISGINGVDGQEARDPYEKWSAYNELYVLADETIEALQLNVKGSLQRPSGLPIKVEHYSWEKIKDSPELRNKVKRMIEIGAVGFGVIDELGTLRTLRFHDKFAQSIHEGQQVQLTSIEEGKKPVTISPHVESLPTDAIGKLFDSLLKEMEEAEQAEEKQIEATIETMTAPSKEGQAATGREAPLRRAAGAAPPKIAAPSLTQEQQAAQAIEQQQINAKFHVEERRRREKAEKKREAAIKHEENFIKHDTLKREIKAGEIKREAREE